MRVRSSIGGVTILLIVGMASACSTGQNTATQGPTVMTWGKEQDGGGIYPADPGGKSSFEILSPVYEPVVGIDDKGQPAPEAAESWQRTSPTTWTLTLRKGMRFSNGREANSNDLTASFDYYKAAGQLDSYWVPYVSSWKAISSYGVEFTFSRPQPAFPAYLEAINLMPGYEVASGSIDLHKAMLGTGPYMVKDHQPDVSWTFVKNPFYWRAGYPKVSQINVRILKDETARVAALQSGSIDFAIFQNPQAKRILSGASIKVEILPTTDFYTIDINGLIPQNNLMTDVRVRRAIMFAIDRTQLVNEAFGGVPTLSDGTGASWTNGCEASNGMYAKSDLNQARSLIQAAGAAGATINLLYSDPDITPLSSQEAQVIQQDLQNIGLKVKLTNLDAGSWVDAFIKKSAFDLDLVWRTGGGDATDILGDVLPSSQPDAVWKFVPPDDALVALIRQAQAMDPTDPNRRSVLQQFCNLADAQAAGQLALVTKPTIVAYRTGRVTPTFAPLETYQRTFRYFDRFTVAGH